MLSLSGVAKSFAGRQVVRGLDLELRPGECFGLLGPNGAGKTTTLRLILGLTEPDAGSIDVLGFQVPVQSRQARLRVGVVPQLDNLDPDFTLYENLLVYGRYFGLAADALAERIPELLAFAGLEDRHDSKIQTLSGGMKRRLTLARSLINNPDLLLMDEPTTGLDPQARHLIWARLKNLVSVGKTILLTTHFMDEAERLCDRIVIMDHGRVIAHGTPIELIERSVEAEVVEVRGVRVREAIEPLIGSACVRVEYSADTVFCYTNDAALLMQVLAPIQGLRYIHRRANLEDVFLKLTGRDLRD